MFELGGMLIKGIADYFTARQEIKKIKVEGEKKVLAAEAEAKVKRLAKESEQDFTLDQLSMKNMDRSWKDELILIVWLVPVIMCFIPDYQPYVVMGFEALTHTPEWYQYILIGMVVVIYGLRGLLKAFIERSK